MPGEPADGDASGALPASLHPAAEQLFAGNLGRAERYARFLCTAGLERGLLGPREASRIWVRHLLNSAVLSLVVPAEATVVDVGSGAGLPGIPLALARPELRVALLEPMLRRVSFLEEATIDLGLTEQVSVVRGRAPEDVAALPFLADCVAARAVAPLERLVSWTMPLVRPGGALLALRGERAAGEVQAAGPAVARAGGAAPEVLRVGADLLPEPAVVVRVRRAEQVRRAQQGKPRRAGRHERGRYS